jgi:HSP20 family protein
MPIIRFNPFPFSRMMPQWPNTWDEDEWPEVTMNEGLDVFETDNEIVVKAAVPGVPADHVDVTFEDGVLRITARSEEAKEEKEKRKVVYRQQRVSSFDYTTTLPRAVDGSSIQAEVNDGVVTVKAPIAPAAKPKKIAVKTKGK